MAKSYKNFSPEVVGEVKTTQSVLENLSEKKLIHTPSSTALHRTAQTLGLSADVPNIKERLREVKLASHNKTDISLSANGENIIVEYKTEKEIVRISLETGLNQKSNKTARKFFRLIMTYANNSPNPYAITLNSADLVKFTNYSRPSTLNRAFDSVITPLRKMGIGYSFTNKTTNKVDSVAEAPYFSLLARKGNLITIKFNPEIDLNSLFRFWTVYKPSAFQLSDNAFLVYDEIMYLARQNMSKIADYDINGTKVRGLRFNINLKIIAETLNLPIYNPTNPKTQIKDPIDKALSEIEDADKDFYVSIKGIDENCRIEEYLSNGRLEITLTGDYVNHFEEQQTKSIEKKKKSEKKMLLDKPMKKKSN